MRDGGRPLASLRWEFFTTVRWPDMAPVSGVTLKHARRDQLLDDLLHGAFSSSTPCGVRTTRCRSSRTRVPFSSSTLREADEVDADDAAGDVYLTHASAKLRLSLVRSPIRLFGPHDLAQSLAPER